MSYRNIFVSSVVIFFLVDHGVLFAFLPSTYSPFGYFLARVSPLGLTRFLVFCEFLDFVAQNRAIFPALEPVYRRSCSKLCTGGNNMYKILKKGYIIGCSLCTQLIQKAIRILFVTYDHYLTFFEIGLEGIK